MSHAEQTAYKLYDMYHLDVIDDDVKKCLVYLLMKPQGEEKIDYQTPQIPQSYEEAMAMGAHDVEMVREELHEYAAELAKEFNLK